MFPFGLSANFQASYVLRQFEYLNTGVKRKLPDFLMLNARISQEIKRVWGVGSEVFFEMSNMTDKDYDEGSGPMPGRNFLAGMTLRY